MAILPKHEYWFLILGDILLFGATLYLSLWLRYFAVPGYDIFMQHLVPFAILFVLWIGVFFIAGLYGKHTRVFRRRLPAAIFWSQTINICIAALFFFLVPQFGIAPKTTLLLYLLLSSPLIFLWRVLVYPYLPKGARLKAVLIGGSADTDKLVEEVEKDSQHHFFFSDVIDTRDTASHEVIQKACRFTDEKVSLIIVDSSDPAVSQVLPILYDTAFQQERIAVVDIIDIYQEVFDRVPLEHVRYSWILARVSSSTMYDTIKRGIDIIGASIVGLVTIPFFPLVMLAIKLDDGGDVFITQARVGRRQQPLKIYKFRTMTGNDHGNYDEAGKSRLVVTRLGKWLRMLRIDELPQVFAVLTGGLSLVGPRPELPIIAAQYSARIPYYNARYLVAPGLTGWAQIRHDKEPHHGVGMEETKEKLAYDLYYLAHRSLWLDVFILFQTVRIVVTARGS